MYKALKRSLFGVALYSYDEMKILLDELSKRSVSDVDLNLISETNKKLEERHAVEEDDEEDDDENSDSYESSIPSYFYIMAVLIPLLSYFMLAGYLAHGDENKAEKILKIPLLIQAVLGVIIIIRTH